MRIYRLTASSMPRRGYDGFCRGGIRWPSVGTATHYVTESLLALVKAETMVSKSEIEEVKELPPGEVLRDIPEPTYVDHAARALDESKRLDLEAAAIKAQLELESKRVRNAKLREDLEAAKRAEPAPEKPKK
jgi:hypothetical protein